MSSFDPTTVRKAVEEFTPIRPQKFQDLFPAKDVIAELRQKRAAPIVVGMAYPKGNNSTRTANFIAAAKRAKLA